MQGQKSCKHTFELKAKSLGGQGYYAICSKCGKYLRNTEIYRPGKVKRASA